jgi:hypothetical protein
MKQIPANIDANHSESLCQVLRQINSTLSVNQEFLLQLDPGAHFMCELNIRMNLSSNESTPSGFPSIYFVGDKSKISTIFLPVNLTGADSIKTFGTITFRLFQNVTYDNIRFAQESPFVRNTVSELIHDRASVRFYNCSFDG